MTRFNLHSPLPRQQAIRVPALPYRHLGMARMPARPFDRLSRVTFRTWRALRTGIEADFRLAVLLMCCTLALLTMTPFAVYRFMQGQIMAGLIDLALVVVIAAANVHAWRSKRSAGAAYLMVTINTLGSLAITPLIGINALFWVYALILLNFFLIDRRHGLAASAVLIGGIAFLHGAVISPAQMFGFVATAALVSLYAFIFAARVDLQQLHLKGLAQKDPLTGAGNRRLMELDLAHAVAGVQGHPQTALVVLDLDHFKRVNDAHGHAAGDAALCAFADIVRASVRRGDRLYRFGGEEFVLLLNDIGATGLAPAVAKVLALVRERLRGPGGAITTSIGAAMLQPDERWQDWLARADDALLSAKRTGRDRIVIAGDDPASEQLQAPRPATFAPARPAAQANATA